MLRRLRPCIRTGQAIPNSGAIVCRVEPQNAEERSFDWLRVRDV